MADSFKEWLEQWAEQQLGAYTESIKLASAPRSKEFNDPIWGTIVLHPAEILVLDSPLLQRLRLINQLGVVHFVYSSARHSRLDHTIGVVHQVSRLVRSINEHGSDQSETTPIGQSDEALLRMAALCHDVGHGALSHVSENALDGVQEIEDMTLAFADEIEGEARPLAEIAAYHIVGSPAFHALLATVSSRVAHSHLPLAEDTVAKIRAAIVGKPISDEVPLMHELISGPFDADKLDYMTRDARMAGIPDVTDIARLVQKVRSVPVPRDTLPDEIGEQAAGGKSHYVVTGVAFSGGRAVDELILGRTIQRDKLFRHHKVRAVEAMVASMYRELTEVAGCPAAELPYRLEDADFLRLTPDRISEVAGGDVDPSAPEVETLIDLADRIRRRDLFCRAYAFALGVPLDPYRCDAEHYGGMERLIRDSRNASLRRKLVDAIVKAVEDALELLGDPLRERYPRLAPYVVLGPVSEQSKPNDSSRTYLIVDDGDPPVLRFQDEYAETARWAEAYIITREVGYVFSPRDLAPYVYAATEKVFRRDYGIRTPDTLLIYTKQRDTEIADVKERLTGAGYYDGMAPDIRPTPRRLTKADVPKRIETLCKTLAGYEGPVRGAARNKKRSLLNPERVRDWLAQFPAELEDEPLMLLEEIQLISRDHVVGALDEFMQGNQDFEGSVLCPFGDPKDSSAVTTYWALDGTGGRVRAVELRKAVLAEKPQILFVEDFIGSGSQSVSVLEAWLGVEPSTDLHEHRDPLEPLVAKQFRKSKLGFVFASGTDEGAERLRECCAELELDNVVHVNGNSMPQAFTDGASDRRRALRDFCERVGSALLLDPDSDHDEEWVSKRALGYGNDAYLVVFGYNTPTQALTCLWKDGTFDGAPWIPLFPRRSKH